MTVQDYYQAWHQATQIEDQGGLWRYYYYNTEEDDKSGWEYCSRQIKRWRSLNRARLLNILDHRTQVELDLIDGDGEAIYNLAVIRTTLTRYRQLGQVKAQAIRQREKLTWAKRGGQWVITASQQEVDGYPWPPEPLQSSMQLQLLARRRWPEISTVASGQYNRQRAVSYAARWWNDFNPQYKRFAVDCTNFVSQTLRAGGAPMTYVGQPRGWWYLGSGGESDRWSLSWAVAHSLRWYLPTSQTGLHASEVESADQLQLGDVISYDFDGDGKWQHSTVVVDFDAYGQPLVAAHTVAAFRRYWTYQDSPAWSENIQYKFWHLPERF
ncbi:MAG: amidase domain-containing protein [Firmicutes bacterium]|nr:amidase domain-containing protein [Bacillota bacterium]